MKTAIYIRTSTMDQNPENQLIELERYAQAMGYKYNIFEEKESTRGTRPIKNDVLMLLREKRYDALLIWKLDRWGRSLQELITDLQELTDKGVKIISLKENIDYTTSSGKLFAQILASFAEYERSIIRERTMAGLQRARAEGKRLGRPPRHITNQQKTPSVYYKKKHKGKYDVHL